MSQVQDAQTRVAALPGAVMVRRIRRLLIVALSGLFVYSALVTASRGACTDDVVPSCVQVDMHPSPAMAFIVVGMLLWALTRVLRRADDEAAALRILDRSAAVMLAVLLLAVIASQLWLRLVPLENWSGTGWFGLPFPFSTVELKSY